MKALLLLAISSLGYSAIPSGAFIATLGVMNQSGGCATSCTFGGYVGNYWMTQQSYSGPAHIRATVNIPPGSGTTYTFTIEHATLSPSQYCSDISSWTSITLGTISGTTQRMLDATIAYSGTGPECIIGRATKSAGTSLALGGGTFAMTFESGLGNLGSGATGMVATTGMYIGSLGRNTNIDRGHWIFGAPITAVGGVVAIPTAPGGGGSWSVSLAYSTTAPTATQSCADISRSTISIGSIAGSNKSISWSPTALSLPANYCLQIQVLAVGSPTSFQGDSAGLDIVTPAPALFYGNASSGAFDANHLFGACYWAIADANCVAGATIDQRWWIAPPSGLSACSGGFTLASASGGTGQFNVLLSASTTAASSTQSCALLTYADSGTLCSFGSGDKGCRFSLTEFSAPANACFALKVTTSGGSPTNSSEFNWGATCTPSPNGVTIGSGVVISGGVSVAH